MTRGTLAAILALSLLVNAFCLPAGSSRLTRALEDNRIDLSDALLDKESKELDPAQTEPTSSTLASPEPYDDDDDFDEPMKTSSTTGGGSSIFSLLNLVSALFPGSSGGNAIFRKIIKDLIVRVVPGIPIAIRREDVQDNVIDTDDAALLKPPILQRQESEDSSNSSSDSDSESISASEEDNAAEESIEDDSDNGNASKQDSNSDADSNESDDSDERPGGDGQGGGILGLLAGLSGGEDGESDLGTLLAAVSGIVANLSGDGFDLNSLIGSAFGLFAGLLSEGEENPGAVVASYLLTSLDTITGGGAQNNGAFFGRFLSKLVKGTSAGGDPDASSEEGDEDKMADSAGFFISLLMSLLGDMSKGSSGSSSS